VRIVADADEEGRKHTREVAAALQGVAASVELFEPANGKDVSDHLAAGLSLDDLVPIGGATATVEPEFRFEVTTARDFCRLPDPPCEPLVGPLLVRGDRTVIGAATGEGKTTFCLALVRATATGKEFLGYTPKRCRTLILDAEQGQKTIKLRLTEAGLDDSIEVDIIRAADGLSLDRDQQQLAALEAVIAAGGYGAVVLDPLYKLHQSDSNEERGAVDLMRALDRLREQYRFALLVPMHTRKSPPNGAKFTMNELFGSAAYPRGAEIVLGLQRPNDGYAFLHIFKDRDGELRVPDRWPLLFDREDGYRRDPKAKERNRTTAELIRDALADGVRMTAQELEKAIDRKVRTIQKATSAMDDIDVLPIAHNEFTYSLRERLAGLREDDDE
jgi:hypothetical protein